MAEILPQSIRALVARRIRNTTDTRTIIQQIQDNCTHRKKLAKRVIQTRPTATTQWHTILPKSTFTEGTRAINRQTTNRFYLLGVEPVNEETRSITNTPDNPPPEILYSEKIPLPTMEIQRNSSSPPNTPEKQKEILDKLDKAFGRPKNTTWRSQTPLHMSVKQPPKTKTEQTTCIARTTIASKIPPEVRAIFARYPIHLIKKAVKELQEEQRRTTSQTSGPDEPSQTMRDIASLQIPPPPKTTCEEIPEETQAPIRVAPGKWSKSNQKKRLILALKRNKDQNLPRERLATPRPNEEAQAALAQAEIRHATGGDVYISLRKSMNVGFFIHSKSKQTEALALRDSGATENFLNLNYAKYLHLPIKRLAQPRKLFNVDRTPNKGGDLQFYTNLQVQTGTQRTNLRFFLSDLGENKAILGYPWFAAVQPNIDWKRGWIDHSQLPIIFRAPDAAKARFLPRTINQVRAPSEEQIYIGRVVIEPDPGEEFTPFTFGQRQESTATPSEEPPKDTTPPIPPQYSEFTKVFSEEASHNFPPSRIWDHAIELKPGAPSTLPGRLIRLCQAEQQELSKFIQEHLKRKTIRPSKSPYVASFFFIKKKDGSLRPVQDYRPVNQWTIKNKYPLPLILQLVDRLRGCTLYTKFDIRWGYNNVRIKEGDEWKAAFLTNEGLFEPTVMFFGLPNSPATFQPMMNTIFATEVAQMWLTIYMDDMAIHTKRLDDETEEQHLKRHRKYVKHILAKLEQHDLFLKPQKCTFKQPSIEFLGVTVDQGTVQMDNKKIEKVQNWPVPTSVTEVRKFLGFTGYYRYFIQNYSSIARPLLDLTQKATPWHWEDRQQDAFIALRLQMCSKPILQQLDFNKLFHVYTDASAYGVGAILSQEGEINPLKPDKSPKHHPIAYYSATFTPTERNYDIYEQELLAIIKAITHWRPYLIWTKEPFTIHTDHANLLYWKSPRKLNRRTARWHSKLQDYHFELKHVPGKLHTAAAALSSPPGVDQGALDNQEMTMIPESTFIKVLNEDSPGSLEHRITMCQQLHQPTMKLWETSGAIEQHSTNTQTMWKDTLKGRLVIPPDNDIRRQIMDIWHEGPTGGHPGRDETTRRIEEHYYWPGARVWIADYIKGCASCQQNKNLTTRQKTPLYRIPVEANPAPFTHVAMDLITGLPKSGGYDAILTIVDHGCSRAAIFLPCTTNITGAQIARLYFDNVYRWFGLPTRIISDRDPRFTSHFGKALTKSLGIQQNLSTAYHPQTDGLSERKNQWVEQYLRLIATN